MLLGRDVGSPALPFDLVYFPFPGVLHVSEEMQLVINQQVVVHSVYCLYLETYIRAA